KKLKAVEIDLGGFAKGWSVDEAYKIAKGEWIYLDAGGDMRFSFHRDQNIGVLNPFDPATDIAKMTMHHGAIATSSTVFRRWTTNKGERHHILDGRTGENARSDVIQATVLTNKVQKSEVYAKVMCMRNAIESIQWLKRHCPEAAAILITEDKKIFLTSNIADYCKGVKTAWKSQLGNGPEFQV
ncbi:FAD:protein FMN transferase, partial [Halobacillus sp. BBL2006]|uniref:FAD:protein FMN transferase n=1 Tax=Halobacillus sp. BBL2006 TaxID=1543706 RepID=UPI0018CDAAA6